LADVRALAIALLSACAAAPPPVAAPPPRPGASQPARPPVDPIAALAGEPAEVAWLVPGPIQLELGGPTLAAGGAGRPIEVAPIDDQGNLVRVAVRLEHARFSLWIDRGKLLAVLARDHKIDPLGPPVIGGDVQVVLHAGARLQRLGHKDHATHVRYLGELEVEGWVPDALLGERGRPRDGLGRIPTGRQTRMVTPGSVIRTEPRWASSALATTVNTGFLDVVERVDDAWLEVSYEDGDVSVRGFLSLRDPPGRVHHWHERDAASAAPNGKVANGTCLYARAGGEPVGYVVGDRPAELEDAGDGWWTVTLDTPWGPLGFAAQGAADGPLAACGPRP
jgi:hypothetical protein